MTKPKGRTRRSQRIPFWRTVGLVIVIVVGLAVIGFFAATVIVTLDEVQQWAPLMKKSTKLGGGYRRLRAWWRCRPVRPKRPASWRRPNPKPEEIDSL